MKYLCTLALVISLSHLALSASSPYENKDFNEDVTRKFNLDIKGVVEVITDIRF